MDTPTDLLESPSTQGMSGSGDAAGSTTTTVEPARRKAAGLASLLLPDLQTMATGLGVPGIGKLRKGQLIEAIEAARGGAAQAAEPTAAERTAAAPAENAPAGRTRRAAASRPAGQPAATETEPTVPLAEAPAVVQTPAADVLVEPAPQKSAEVRAPERTGSNDDDEDGDGESRSEGGSDDDRPARRDRNRERRERQRAARQERLERAIANGEVPPDAQNLSSQNGNGQNGNGQNDRPQNNQSQAREQQPQRQPQQNNQSNSQQGGWDDDDSRGGRRRGRFRDRNDRSERGPRARGNEADPVIGENDVLIPIAGIVDINDREAFVRTSGYLTGPNDVYVTLNQVKKYGLRRGDAVTGAVRQQVEGEAKPKFNALVRLDTVSGLDAEAAKARPEFTKLTPLYPNERLRLETRPEILTTRVIDLVMPLGKGQRALIVSPPKAGKTMVLQSIANAITVNNPEAHLMVVLVDERPEEVTDMTRSVKGEVIASTFDRPPTDHIAVAELSIERAKRLVELGHDVVVLLDSITRLGRAYNLGAPASGRILTGGVDSAALYPPKRFLGAARNIEHGGSLTILATALVETGSAMDTVIFEEFKGTGNAELKLDRRIADKRVFPAVDIDQSSTRKEELLLAPDEMRIVLKLRRVLHSLEKEAGLELLLDKLKQTRSNVEFLLEIAKTTPGAD